MIYLGINSFFEHPSVAFVKDGKILYAAEDERFTGIKHGRRYSPYNPYIPFLAIHQGLQFIGAKASDIKSVSYSYSPSKHITSLYGCFTGERFNSFFDELCAFVTAKIAPILLRKEEYLSVRFEMSEFKNFSKIPFKYWEHHLCHAASSLFCSTFENALILVADGAGEKACTTAYISTNGMDLIKVYEQNLPHSLGHFYSYITRYLGFEPFSDEYKVMGMSAYGKNRYRKIFSEVLELHLSGKYRLNIDKLRQINLFVGPPRKAGEPLTDVHFDIAKSAQEALESAVLHILKYLRHITGKSFLCLAGGTFLNCVCNAKIVESEMFDDVFVQPAANDAGTALGAAALDYASYGNKSGLSFTSAFLGSEYYDVHIGSVLKKIGIDSTPFSEEERLELMSSSLAEGKICGIFKGRMEFGPRALGNRSILANALFKETRYALNEIKCREQFRPVAPVVLDEDFEIYFRGKKSKYMLFTAKVRDEKIKEIPSACHVDGTARVQTITKEDDSFLYNLLLSFKQKTGHSLLINTSFNLAGKPIVESPTDAVSSFLSSKIDCLMIGSYFLSKKTIW